MSTERARYQGTAPCDVCGVYTPSHLGVCRKTPECRAEYRRRLNVANREATQESEQASARVSQHVVEQARAALLRSRAADRARNGLAPAATEATRLARIEARLARIEAALPGRRTA